MKRLFLSCIIFFFTGCASLPADFIGLDDHLAVDLDSIMNIISDERVIFIGEIHGTASTHLLQLEIIKRLRQRGNKLVVALEAFPFTRQAILDKWIEGSLEKDDFKRMYGATWSIPFDYYEGIFDYAKEQRIPLMAMNADNTLILEVSRDGLEAAPKDLLEKIKYTDCSTDAMYKEMLKNIHHASQFPFFCEGQRLRDSVMAFNISTVMRGNNYKVVVIAGVAHASKFAVPLILEKLTGTEGKVLLPEDVKYFLKRTPDRGIADYIWY